MKTAKSRCALCRHSIWARSKAWMSWKAWPIWPCARSDALLDYQDYPIKAAQIATMNRRTWA
jgi:hypothetical protein